MKIGVNNCSVGSHYPLCIEPLYTHPITGAEPYQTRAIKRIRELRDAGSEVIVVFKFQENNDNAYGVSPQLQEQFRKAIPKLIDRIGPGVGVSFGNEPNLQSIMPAWWANVCREIAAKVKQDVKLYTTAIAPWAPFGEVNDASVEQSPWAQYAVNYYWEVGQEQPWHGVLLHVYTDGRIPDVGINHDSHGWRWDMNTALTWKECLADPGLDKTDIVVSEFNASAHNTDYKPSDYRCGSLQEMAHRMDLAFGDYAYGLAWFLDDPRGNEFFEGLSLKNNLHAAADLQELMRDSQGC